MNAQFAQLRGRFLTGLKPVIEWYQGRAPQEQRILQWLALIAAVLLMIIAIWMPAWNIRSTQLSEYQSQQKLLTWIQSNETQIRQTKSNASGQPSLGDDWIAGLSRSATDSSVTIKSFNPEGNNSVRVQLENQAFAAAFNWLQKLSGLGIQVVSAEFTPGQEEGRVNLRASLSSAL